MSAQGYRSNPLSDAMEARIRERIAAYRADSEKAHKDGREYESCVKDGGIAALEWVLNEAEAYKAESSGMRVVPPPSNPRWDEFCPDCGHLHCDDAECGFPIGGGRKCLCERKVTA